MEYRGVRHVIRTGIVHRHWVVVVYPNNDRPIERTVKGSRMHAEVLVRGIIDELETDKAATAITPRPAQTARDQASHR